MGGPARIDGKYISCTDNFFICKFAVKGEEFVSSEHYFQAVKCVDEKERRLVKKATSGMQAWSRGNHIKLRKGWDAIRVDEMYIGNFAKFEQNEEYKKILCSTTGEIRCGGSSGFWNTWNAVILTRIREELRDENERNKEALQECIERMKKFREEESVRLGLTEE